jgi:hypothetical protein
MTAASVGTTMAKAATGRPGINCMSTRAPATQKGMVKTKTQTA